MLKKLLIAFLILAVLFSGCTQTSSVDSDKKTETGTKNNFTNSDTVSSQVPATENEEVDETVVVEQNDLTDSDNATNIESTNNVIDASEDSIDTSENTFETQSSNTIEITANGFNPKSLTVKKGTTITFVNKTVVPSWPASAVHPTHTVYPGSSISKCNTSDAATIFDACKGLAENESFSFTFNEIGTWKYHDHLNPSVTGIIVVEE